MNYTFLLLMQLNYEELIYKLRHLHVKIQYHLNGYYFSDKKLEEIINEKVHNDQYSS